MRSGGYVKLGQSASRSRAARRSGETRLELSNAIPEDAVHSGRAANGAPFADVKKLLEVLQALVDAGNTMVVIEHNLDVIKQADWIVDLGPEGGDRGGTIVVAGTPEEIARCPVSHTGLYLKDVLRT